ncbi:HIT family protein [Saprospiraceae bacterium]|nr:HIT family protein [Saprospiraceae bacterium]MDB4162596.1 HIT family protein [Saprospiraceae bacterium]MDB9914389.1 HIT family protein [Saprospiraceae bacterium]
MASTFTKIINGDIPCHKIAEDDKYFAFLDINPVKEGHTLVIPKQEVDYIYDLDDETLAGLNVFAKKVAKAVKSACSCNRIGVTVIGLEVPHAHIHLIPIEKLNDMSFEKPKMNPTQVELTKVASRIRSFL